MTALLQVNFAAERPVVREFVFAAQRQDEMRLVLTIAQGVGVAATFVAETQFRSRAAERVTHADSRRQITALKVFAIFKTELPREVSVRLGADVMIVNSRAVFVVSVLFHVRRLQTDKRADVIIFVGREVVLVFAADLKNFPVIFCRSAEPQLIYPAMKFVANHPAVDVQKCRIRAALEAAVKSAARIVNVAAVECRRVGIVKRAELFASRVAD